MWFIFCFFLFVYREYLLLEREMCREVDIFYVFIRKLKLLRKKILF